MLFKLSFLQARRFTSLGSQSRNPVLNTLYSAGWMLIGFVVCLENKRGVGGVLSFLNMSRRGLKDSQIKQLFKNSLLIFRERGRGKKRSISVSTERQPPAKSATWALP